MNYLPQSLQKIIASLQKLPGVGKKTAERFAFTLLDWDESILQSLACELADLKKNVKACQECGCLISKTSCTFCDSTIRSSNTLCVIATAKDAIAMEQTGTYDGLYHVLGALLSPLDGITEENLPFTALLQRIEKLGVQEIILALDSTLEGDATALFLKSKFEKIGIKCTRLAFGIPIGSSLEYIDENTLSQALKGRATF